MCSPNSMRRRSTPGSSRSAKSSPERAFKRIAEIDFVNLAGLPVAGQRMLAIFVFAVIAWITEAESYEVSSVMLLLFAASWWLGWI